MMSWIYLWRSSFEAEPWLATLISDRTGEVTFKDAACLKRLFPEIERSFDVSLTLLVTCGCACLSIGDA
jgi:hypothetical protein